MACDWTMMLRVPRNKERSAKRLLLCCGLAIGFLWLFFLPDSRFARLSAAVPGIGPIASGLFAVAFVGACLWEALNQCVELLGRQPALIADLTGIQLFRGLRVRRIAWNEIVEISGVEALILSSDRRFFWGQTKASREESSKRMPQVIKLLLINGKRVPLTEFPRGFDLQEFRLELGELWQASIRRRSA